jgi:hypothetical protein
MPRGGPRANSGGWRPGAGRKPKELTDKQISKVCADAGISPLEYLLSLVTDGEQPVDVRMRAAGMALPYCHGKKGEEPAQKPAEPADVAEAAMGGRYAPRRVRGFGVVDGDRS